MTTTKLSKYFLVVALALSCATTSAGTPDGSLSADGNDAQTYQLITSSGCNYEVPDASRDHKTSPVRHIIQTYDNDLKKYVFGFQIHALIDDDRGLANITDRQRVEIKTDNGSPQTMTAQEGETVTMRWKMKLPAGMLTTKNFCHLHQLKGVDNKNGTADVSSPLITLTAVTSNGVQKMQLRYFNRKTRKTEYKTTANLSDFLGQWVEITEVVTYGHNTIASDNGRYDIIIRRLSDNKTLMQFSQHTDIDLWQTDCLVMRPKWGIYRSIGTNRSLENDLRDEEIRFADFSIIEGTASNITENRIRLRNAETIPYTLSGIPCPTPSGGIYVIAGRKYTYK